MLLRTCRVERKTHEQSRSCLLEVLAATHPLHHAAILVIKLLEQATSANGWFWPRLCGNALDVRVCRTQMQAGELQTRNSAAKSVMQALAALRRERD